MQIARRVFLGIALTGSAGWLAVLKRADGKPVSRLPEHVRIADFDNAGHFLRIAEVATIRRSDADWKRLLAVDQYTMTRRGDTELAYAGEFWNFHEEGLYRCVCCGTALFHSNSKYSSGTGWPSFFAPVAPENVAKFEDHSWGQFRTAVSCARCDAHLGHVFEDGPPPTGLRYCVNSVALKFASPRNLT